MLSIIVCSINKDSLNRLKENVVDTVGVPFEIIAFDNSENRLGICKVYNHCANQAKYDFLCFAHEDIIFNTLNWGEIIIAQLQSPDCGVIGFAGSTFKSKNQSGWGSGNRNHLRFNYIEADLAGNEHSFKQSNGEIPFSQVAVLDGFCLFSSKKVWEENGFDENTFTDFHFYDLDFSLQVFRNYKNYVCHEIEVKHFSSGSYRQSWIDEGIKFHEKWSGTLPLYLTTPPKSCMKKDEIKSLRDYMRLLRKTSCEKSENEIKRCIKKLRTTYLFYFLTWKILFNYYLRNKI